MKKRIFAGLMSTLLVATTVATLAACADNKGGTTTTAGSNGNGTTPGTGTNDLVKPSLPSFGTEEEPVTINFAVSEADDDGFHKRSIGDVETYDPDNDVDAAVFTRNQKVQEELGVEIVIAEYNNNGIRGSAVRDALMAQDDTYDVICGVQWTDCQLVLDDVLADLTMLEDENKNPINYINYNAKYWSSYYIDAMKCGESIFWLTGDLCLRYSGGFYCFFVNTDLYEQSLKGEYGSMYDVVKSGKWTYDTLIEMSKKAFVDLDGDDSSVSREDQQGVALPTWDNINGMSVAAGVEYCSRGDDGSITNTFNSSNTTLVDFMGKVNELYASGTIYQNYGGDYAGAMADLESNYAVFASGRLNQAELYLQNMNAYMVIPCPKLNESQNYRSSVHDAVQLYGINDASTKKPAAAATLELMAYYSYVDVRPVYYDSALKYRYTTDEGAAEMINLMSDVVYSDFVYIWQFCQQFNSMGDLLRGRVNGKNNFASIVKRTENSYAKGLEKVMEELKELDY